MPDTCIIESGNIWPRRYTIAELETIANAAGVKKCGPIAKEKLQRAVEAYQWATTVDSGGPFFRSNKDRRDQIKRILKLRAENAPAEKIDEELEAVDAVTSQLLPNPVGHPKTYKRAAKRALKMLSRPGPNRGGARLRNPKTDTVSYEGKDKDGKPVKATYQRAQLSSQSDAIKNDIDPAFANDQHWLLLPFHVLRDGATAVDEVTQKLPLGDGSAQRVAFKYPSEGGYQPGDTWDFYIGPDKRIQELVYHRGGPNPPHLVTATYTDYKKAGPLLIAMDHRGTTDGNPLHLWISDVSVKLTGSDKWINAQ
jgi:hypothetical protein